VQAITTSVCAGAAGGIPDGHQMERDGARSSRRAAENTSLQRRRRRLGKLLQIAADGGAIRGRLTEAAIAGIAVGGPLTPPPPPPPPRPPRGYLFCAPSTRTRCEAAHAIAAAHQARYLGRDVAGSGKRSISRCARRRRLYLWRRDPRMIAEPRGPARRGARAPAVSGSQGTVGQLRVVNNVVPARERAVDQQHGAQAMRTSAWANSRGTLPISRGQKHPRAAWWSAVRAHPARSCLYEYGGGHGERQTNPRVQRRSGPLALIPAPRRYAVEYEALAGWAMLVPRHRGVRRQASTWRRRRATRWHSAPSNPAASARSAGRLDARGSSHRRDSRGG